MWSADFFQNKLLKKLFQEHYQSDPDHDILIWVQTSGDIKIKANKERVIVYEIQ